MNDINNLLNKIDAALKTPSTPNADQGSQGESQNPPVNDSGKPQELSQIENLLNLASQDLVKDPNELKTLDDVESELNKLIKIYILLLKWIDAFVFTGFWIEPPMPVHFLIISHTDFISNRLEKIKVGIQEKNRKKRLEEKNHELSVKFFSYTLYSRNKLSNMPKDLLAKNRPQLDILE